MTRNEIEERVRTFLTEDLEIDGERIFNDARLKEDIGIDSLDYIDVVMLTEDNFGVKIRPEEMKGILTLKQFLDYIESKISQ